MTQSLRLRDKFKVRLVAIAGLVLVTLLSGCASAPPNELDDICEIFREKSGWYEDAKTARARWGVPISIMMAFMHQESRFVATAKPARKKLWGFIPGPRPSDAYGYSQAKDATWTWYERSSGSYGADRDNFEDAIDFIGWYNDVSHKTNGIAKTMGFDFIWPTTRGTGAISERPIAPSNGLWTWPKKSIVALKRITVSLELARNGLNLRAGSTGGR